MHSLFFDSFFHRIKSLMKISLPQTRREADAICCFWNVTVKFQCVRNDDIVPTMKGFNKASQSESSKLSGQSIKEFLKTEKISYA